MIKDPSGKVYLMYYQPIQKYIAVGSKEYVSTVQHGVSMLLAEEVDVPALLSYRGGCCGKQIQVFHLPVQEAINVWLTGER